MMLNKGMAMLIPFEWEVISHLTYRAKAVGGWIVRYGYSEGTTCVFIPDEYHTWKIE
jgi:hypothetical protein